MIPDNLTKLIIDMEFISAAKVECKPCFSNRTYMNKKSWYGSLYRYYYGESAQECTRFIEMICLKLAKELVINNNNDYYNILIDKTLSLRLGILTLIDTYKEDIDIVSSLNNSILSIMLMLPESIKIKHNLSKK